MVIFSERFCHLISRICLTSSTLMDLFFFVCVLLLFMLSSWLCTLLGLQLIKLLFGEFGQHADSGSYSSAYAVCVDVCWCNDAFLLFHALNS